MEVWNYSAKRNSSKPYGVQWRGTDGKVRQESYRTEAERKKRRVELELGRVADLVAHDPRGKIMLQLIRETCERAPGYHLDGKIRVGRPVRKKDNYHDASPDQIAALADGMGHKGIIVWCMALAGLRVSEALALRSDDFGDVLTVERQRDRRGGGTSPLKGRAEGDERTVGIDPGAS